MYEGNSPAPCAEAGGLVNQLVSSGATSLEGRVEIGHSVTDMMNAGPAAGEKLPDRARIVQRCQQLHLGLTEWKRDDRCPVYGFRGMRFEAEHVSIEGERLFEIWYGNADMRDAGAIRH
jgi:hypothetical protein